MTVELLETTAEVFNEHLDCQWMCHYDRVNMIDSLRNCCNSHLAINNSICMIFGKWLVFMNLVTNVSASEFYKLWKFTLQDAILLFVPVVHKTLYLMCYSIVATWLAWHCLGAYSSSIIMYVNVHNYVHNTCLSTYINEAVADPEKLEGGFRRR